MLLLLLLPWLLPLLPATLRQMLLPWLQMLLLHPGEGVGPIGHPSCRQIPHHQVEAVVCSPVYGLHKREGARGGLSLIHRPCFVPMFSPSSAQPRITFAQMYTHPSSTPVQCHIQAYCPGWSCPSSTITHPDVLLRILLAQQYNYSP